MLISVQYSSHSRIPLLCFCLDLLVSESTAFSKNVRVFPPSRLMFLLLAHSDGLLVADYSTARTRLPKPCEKKHRDCYQCLPWGQTKKMVGDMPSVGVSTGHSFLFSR